MSNKQDRILSYTLSTVLEESNLGGVSGGSASYTTVGTQKFVNTRGGDTTIVFDNYDNSL